MNDKYPRPILSERDEALSGSDQSPLYRDRLSTMIGRIVEDVLSDNDGELPIDELFHKVRERYHGDDDEIIVALGALEITVDSKNRVRLAGTNE